MKIYIYSLRPRYFLLFFFLPIAIIFLALRASVVHSDAYGAALYFTCTNFEIADHAGKISSLNLPFWEGAYITETGGDGDAYIPLELVAEKGNITVDIYVRREEGLWITTRADIKNFDISISTDSLNGEICNCDVQYCQRGNLGKRRSNGNRSKSE